MSGTISVTRVREVRQFLSAMAGRASNWEPVANEIQETFVQAASSMFRTEGSSEDKGWASYASEPKYALYKKAIVGHNDVLRWDKGGEYEQLYPSLTRPNDAHAVWEQVDSTTFHYGTTAPSAEENMQAGTGPFGEPSPARDFLPTGIRTQEDLVGIIGAFVAGE